MPRSASARPVLPGPGTRSLRWTPEDVDGASGLLGAEQTLEVLTGATAALIEADGYDAGLHAFTGALVPRVANLAAVYVRGEDARLHPRAVTRDRREGVGFLDTPQAGAILDRTSDHPVAQAGRRGRSVLLIRGGAPGGTQVADDGEDAFAGRSVQGLAVPLTARDEVVGVLYLLLAGEERAYGPHDLALGRGLAGRASMVLDNQRLVRTAQEAHRAKGDFLAVMSHELRTPLTAVVGYADLLEAGIPGPVNEEQTVQLQRIKESSWELLELIDGILGYARFEREEPEVVKEWADVAEVVDEAVAVIRTSLEQKALELEIEIAPVPSLYTDRTKLRQILVHLLDNAAKFTAEGTVSLRVRNDHAWIRFAVTDTGTGIPREDQERVFEPFWQGERAETRTAGGTGMGLSLARRLARLLGGGIRLESRPGEGSTFTLLLPHDGSEG